MNKTIANGGVGVYWTGNNGWILTGGGKMVAFDLILEDATRKRPSPVQTGDIGPDLDLLFITHEHSDHFHEGTCERLVRESNCRFVIPVSCLKKAAELGIPDERIFAARPGMDFEYKGIGVHAVRALHGHLEGSIYEGASLFDCGYLLDFCGRRIYEPGDTVLLQEHIEKIRDVDALFFSPTEHNMWIEQSLKLIGHLRPRHIFPQHFDTFFVTPENAFWTIGFPDEVYERLDEEMKQAYHKLGQGELFVI